MRFFVCCLFARLVTVDFSFNPLRSPQPHSESTQGNMSSSAAASSLGKPESNQASKAEDPKEPTKRFFEPQGLSDLCLVKSDDAGLVTEFHVHSQVLAASSKWARALLDARRADEKEASESPSKSSRSEGSRALDAIDSESPDFAPTRITMPDTLSLVQVEQYLNFVYHSSVPSVSTCLNVVPAAFYFDAQSILDQCESFLMRELEIDESHRALPYLELLLLCDQYKLVKLMPLVKPYVKTCIATLVDEPDFDAIWSHLNINLSRELLLAMRHNCSQTSEFKQILLPQVQAVSTDLVLAKRELNHQDTPFNAQTHVGNATAKMSKITQALS